jgi:hypothetical protein
MNPDKIITVIENAYHAYVYGWQVDATSGGACRAIVGELVAYGIATDDAKGEASLEARINRVLDGWAGERVNEEEFAAEVAVTLGLVTADEAMAATG